MESARCQASFYISVCHIDATSKFVLPNLFLVDPFRYVFEDILWDFQYLAITVKFLDSSTQILCTAIYIIFYLYNSFILIVCHR